MAKKFKKELSAFLAALMCMTTISMTAMAQENTWNGTDDSVNVSSINSSSEMGEETTVPAIGLGTKQTELLDRDSNRYEVTIDVPGHGTENTNHDEVILMVDGSYSMDNEWPAMKDAINAIGETVLNGSGTTQLTLMAFGMGDNEVLVHVKDAGDLANALGALPGNLLYGRSSTNCEAGFDGVANYIKNHDENLRDVHVIFISDGNVNTDETPRAFDANWQTWTKFGALTVAQETFGGTVSNGTNFPDAFATVFGDRFDGAANEEIIERAFAGEVTDEEFIAFAEQIWTDVYAYSELTRGKEYPVSVAERAFVKYDKEKGTYIQDLFYYTTYKSAYVTYGDRWTRTPAAANELAAMSEVESMYVVDYDSYTSWMDTGITNEKSSFIQSNGIAGLCEALSGAMTELSKTPFNDVVVTDYMSKWVNIDTTTIKIIDNMTGETVWTINDGWKEGVTPLTSKESPVVVELVDPSEYEAGGDDVIGNTNGDIYKLTWYVKDGALLRSDNYRLSYEVTVDTAEEGFKSKVDYPANGNTNLTYTDENDKNHTNPIEVPTVNGIIKEFTISFNNGDASNISFMLIDKATGEVEFLNKIDIGNETSFKIPSEAGKISAVFVKQSTSGMFWTSEEVDESVQNAVIECLKANNPSYKGYNAFAFGEGSHELEFKNNKFVTYIFGNGEAEVSGKTEESKETSTETDTEISTEDTETDAPIETDAPEIETPAEIETPEIETPAEIETPETKVPETKVPETEASVPEITVEGAKNVEQTVIDGIQVVYIPANGKIPAVVWTTDEVSAETAAAIIEVLGAPDDARLVSGLGTHDIEYNQNKNKTKTVTYTFEIAE